MKADEFFNLRRLGSYLHQDWQYEFSTPDEAVTAFSKDAQPPARSAFCLELAQFIRVVEQITDKEAEGLLWTVAGWEYLPSADGFTVAAWLGKVQQLVCRCVPIRSQPGPPRFRIGDRVRLLYAWRGVIGEVVEDRGNLGDHGQRMYTVRMRLDQWNEMTSEFPEDSLEAVSA